MFDLLLKATSSASDVIDDLASLFDHMQSVNDQLQDKLDASETSNLNALTKEIAQVKTFEEKLMEMKTTNDYQIDKINNLQIWGETMKDLLRRSVDEKEGILQQLDELQSELDSKQDEVMEMAESEQRWRDKAICLQKDISRLQGEKNRGMKSIMTLNTAISELTLRNTNAEKDLFRTRMQYISSHRQLISVQQQANDNLMNAQKEIECLRRQNHELQAQLCAVVTTTDAFTKNSDESNKPTTSNDERPVENDASLDTLGYTRLETATDENSDDEYYNAVDVESYDFCL